MATYMDIMRDVESRVSKMMRDGGGFIGVMSCGINDVTSQSTSALIASEDMTKEEDYEERASLLILRVLFTKIQDLAEMIVAMGEGAGVEEVKENLEAVARRWMPMLDRVSIRNIAAPDEEGPIQ